MISKEVKSILLVDEDEVSNLLNTIFIKKLNLNTEVEVASGKRAIKLLFEMKTLMKTPCLLLLDMNISTIGVWEFLDQYDELIDQDLKNNIVVVMLTVSEEQNNEIREKQNPYIKEFVRKPLSEKSLGRLISAHFNPVKCDCVSK